MYTLIRTWSARQLLAERYTARATAWLVAGMLCQYMGFSPESAASLLTWCAFGALMQGLRRLMVPPRDGVATIKR